MCGLVGMAGNIQADHRKMFKDMLAFDVVRGPHSTGVATADEAGNVQVLKKCVLPHELFNMRDYDRTVDVYAQVIIGHNRWATQGAITAANAHPFEQGDVVGAHNGTLKGQHLLPNHTEFDVDSENLMYAIHELGMTEALALTHGAFALSVYDIADHKLSLVRNKERPLHCCWSKDGDVLMWASEEWMLLVSAMRNQVKIGKVYSMKELTLHEWHLPERKIQKLPDPVVTKVKEYVPPVPTIVESNWAHRYDARNVYGGKNFPQQQPSAQRITGQTTSPSVGGVKVGDIVEFFPLESDGYSVVGCQDVEPFLTVKSFCGSQGYVSRILKHDGPVNGKVLTVCEGKPASSFGAKIDPYVIVDSSSLILVPDRQDDLPFEVYDANGRVMTEKKFNELTRGGCCVCSDNLIYGMDEVHWDNDAAFCIDCWEAFDPNQTLIGEQS